MALRLEDVTVGYYQDIMILLGLTLSAQDEKITTIIGPNGAGNSTVLKTAFGFLNPMKGKVYLDSREITGTKPYQMLRIGMTFVMQERGVFPFLTVQENLELGAWLFRSDRERLKTAIEAIYDKYPMLGKRGKVPAGSLSGGEQRLLEIGKALMTNPQVVLFDEPTAGLSPIAAKLIFQEVEKLKEEQRTILMVEQNVRRAMGITDYVYVLEFGRVTFHGPVGEIRLEEAVAPWVKW